MGSIFMAEIYEIVLISSTVLHTIIAYRMFKAYALLIVPHTYCFSKVNLNWWKKESNKTHHSNVHFLWANMKRAAVFTHTNGYFVHKTAVGTIFACFTLNLGYKSDEMCFMCLHRTIESL